MGIILFGLGLLLFIGLILVHEWGHYILARRNGVEVEEFGLGFPPRAKVITEKKGTIYSLNWLPLGGFVKLKGEHDSDTKEGTFGAANTWAKIKIMMAGVGMNLLAAFVIFTIVALMGMPKLLDNQTTIASDTKVVRTPENVGVIKISEVVPDSPAEKAGLQKDDQFVRVAGQEISNASEVSKQTSTHAGQTIEIEIKRGEEYITKSVTLNTSSPYLGTTSFSAQKGLEIRRSTWSAPIVAAGVMKDFTVATFKGLGSALKGLGSTIAGLITGNSEARKAGQAEASSQVSGPLGIGVVLFEISHEGFGLVLFIIGLISLTLAIMNALPIPALDGGRLFVTLVFRGLKKPLKPEVEDRIHGTGFALLMLLLVLITVVDIRRFF